MKAVALLVFLVVLSAFVSETDAGWFRRTLRRFGKIARRAGRKIFRTIAKGYRFYQLYKRHRGKRGVELNEEEFLDHLATRDISELVDVNQMTEADLNELLSVQRQTRDVMDELEALDGQEDHKLS